MEIKLNKLTKASQLRCILPLIFILSIYVFDNYGPLSIRNNGLYRYIGKPVIWTLLILIVIKLPRVKENGKLRIKNLLIWSTALLSCGYIAITFFMGIIGGFGRSPYDHSFFGIITNLICVLTPIIGREVTRNYFINSASKKNFFINATIFVIFMTLIGLPVDAISKLGSKLEVLEYVGVNLIAGICKNILYTYLVFIGGPLPSIIYSGIQECFLWLLPVIPNIGWIMQVLLSSLYPIFAMMFLQFFYSIKVKKIKKLHIKKENPLGWIITTTVSILIVWFASGVFPVRPYVIATGSMEPVIYPGDVVLVKNVDFKDLKVGDVIQYKHENIYIFHRIIKTVNEDGKVKYQTKGDNNSGPDSGFVDGANYKAKVFYTVPKIGWPTLFLRMNKNIDKSEVEF